MQYIKKKSKGMFVLLIIIIFLALIFLFIKQNQQEETYREVRFEYFDTMIIINLLERGSQKIIDECFEMIAYYEKLFSAYSGEISQLTGYDIVSTETADLIKKGLEYGKISEGLFDITIGAVSSLWDFNEDLIPTDDDLLEALKYVDYTNVSVLDNNIVIFESPLIKIDLGGIAKGYVIDRLIEYLYDSGVASALINFGGQIGVIGNAPSVDRTWKVRLSDPRAILAGEMQEEIVAISVLNKAVSTSGVYRRYFMQDGAFYHHILDPITGYPVNNGLLSVTVVCDYGVDSDALSLIMFVMGLDKGFEFAQNLEGVEAIFITKDIIKATSGLELEYLK